MQSLSPNIPFCQAVSCTREHTVRTIAADTDKITFAFAECTAAGDEITSLADVSADVKNRTIPTKDKNKGAKQTFAELMETASTGAAKAEVTNLLETIQSTQQTNALINLRGDLH